MIFSNKFLLINTKVECSELKIYIYFIKSIIVLNLKLFPLSTKDCGDFNL